MWVSCNIIECIFYYLCVYVVFFLLILLQFAIILLLTQRTRCNNGNFLLDILCYTSSNLKMSFCEGRNMWPQSARNKARLLICCERRFCLLIWDSQSWDIEQCSSIQVKLRFGGTFHFHLRVEEYAKQEPYMKEPAKNNLIETSNAKFSRRIVLQ
jgi:hypothetical protein